MPRTRLAWALALVLVGVVSTRLFFEYRNVGLVGWDTYPLIDVSRVASLGDLFDVFRESLMGKAEGGLYYRPLSTLSLSLDFALFGLWAPGYQLTSAVLTGAAALSLFAAALQLLPGRLVVGALAALSLFLVQPLLATVVPVPARRADILCLLFMSLTLAAQTRAARTGATPSLASGVLALCALLCKETGYILLALGPLAALGVTSARGPSRRIRAAARASIPIVVAVGVALLARFAVLGSIVGGRPLREEGFFFAYAEMMGRIAAYAMSPSAAVGNFEIPYGLLIAIGLASSLAVLLATPPARRALVVSLVPALVVGSAWIGLVGVLYTIGIILQPWYVTNPYAGLALIFGAWLQGLWMLVANPGRARIAAAVASACALGLLVQSASHSPLVHRYGDWQEATTVTETYLASLGAEIARAEPGDVIEVLRPPGLLRKRANATERLQGVAILAPYSVKAWVRLAFPDRRVRVIVAGEGGADPGPGEIVVRLTRVGAAQGI